MEDEATRTRLLAGMLRGKKLGVWRRRLGDSTSSRKCEPTCVAAGFTRAPRVQRALHVLSAIHRRTAAGVS